MQWGPTEWNSRSHPKQKEPLLAYIVIVEGEKRKKNLRTEDIQKISGGKKANLKKKTLNKYPVMWLHGCACRHMGVWPEEAKDIWRLGDELSHYSFCRWLHSLPHYRGDLSQSLMAEVLVKGVRESKYAVPTSGRGCHCLHTSWLQAENCSKLLSYRPCQDILNSF